jgi:hypothetical protein
MTWVYAARNCIANGARNTSFSQLMSKSSSNKNHLLIPKLVNSADEQNETILNFRILVSNSRIGSVEGNEKMWF